MTQRTLAAVAVAIAAALAVPAVRHWREVPPPPPTPPEPLRAHWQPAEAVEVGAGSDYPFGLALAPDGRQLVHPGTKAGVVALWLHDLRTDRARALPGTDFAAAPFWSADGTRIAFFAEGQLRVLDLGAGHVSTLAEAPSPRGGAWNAAGDIVYSPTANAGLMRRSVDGGVTPFTAIDATSGEVAHIWPSFLADGEYVIFTVVATSSSRAGVWIAALDNPQSRRRLLASDSQAVAADTSILILNDQTLMRHALDRDAMTASTRGDPVASPVGRSLLGHVFATASQDVLIVGAPETRARDLVWVSRSGERVGSASEPVDAWDLRIAPGGRRIVVTEIDPQLRTLDVFIREGAQPVPTRLSPSTDVDESGVWSPDGLRIAWVGRRRTVMIRGAGAVLPEQTIATFDPPVQVWDWSRDGRALLVGRTAADTRDDLWMQPPREDTPATPYVVAPFNQTYGAFSPDGRWVAYASDESGKYDIYVDSYPRPGARIRVTTAGGTEPRWSGNELFFRRGSEIHQVSLRATGESLDIASTSRLFDAGAPIRAYDVTADGSRFLINVPAAGRTATSATIAFGWHR